MPLNSGNKGVINMFYQKRIKELKNKMPKEWDYMSVTAANIGDELGELVLTGSKLPAEKSAEGYKLTLCRRVDGNSELEPVIEVSKLESEKNPVFGETLWLDGSIHNWILATNASEKAKDIVYADLMASMPCDKNKRTAYRCLNSKNTECSNCDERAQLTKMFTLIDKIYES